MGGPADERRGVLAMLGAVLADGLGGGEDVRLVEGRVEAGAAVTGGPEDHLLGGLGRIRLDRVVGGDEPGDVHQVAGLGGLSCAGVAHGPDPGPVGAARATGAGKESSPRRTSGRVPPAAGPLRATTPRRARGTAAGWSGRPPAARNAPSDPRS